MNSLELEKLSLETSLVHAGTRSAAMPTGEPTVPPIYAATTFTYGAMEDFDRVFSGEKRGYVYTRYGNPTVAALEEAAKVFEKVAAHALSLRAWRRCTRLCLRARLRRDRLCSLRKTYTA